MSLRAEVRDILCEAGLFAIICFFAACLMMILVPWIWDKTKYARMHLREWIRYKAEIRRIRQAMKVSEKPTFKVRYWKRSATWREF